MEKTTSAQCYQYSSSKCCLFSITLLKVDGLEVMNKPAGLEFAAVLRACCERTELIYKDCEQLDCNAATGLDYFLQKEKFPQKGRETSLVEVRPADNICHMQTPAATTCFSQNNPRAGARTRQTRFRICSWLLHTLAW